MTESIRLEILRFSYAEHFKAAKEKEEELKVYDDLKFVDVNEQIKKNKP